MKMKREILTIQQTSKRAKGLIVIGQLTMVFAIIGLFGEATPHECAITFAIGGCLWIAGRWDKYWNHE